jgi:hypothetical protein
MPIWWDVWCDENRIELNNKIMYVRFMNVCTYAYMTKYIFFHKLIQDIFYLESHFVDMAKLLCYEKYNPMNFMKIQWYIYLSIYPQSLYFVRCWYFIMYGMNTTKKTHTRRIFISFFITYFVLLELETLPDVGRLVFLLMNQHMWYLIIPKNK